MAKTPTSSLIEEAGPVEDVAELKIISAPAGFGSEEDASSNRQEELIAAALVSQVEAEELPAFVADQKREVARSVETDISLFTSIAFQEKHGDAVLATAAPVLIKVKKPEARNAAGSDSTPSPRQQPGSPLMSDMLRARFELMRQTYSRELDKKWVMNRKRKEEKKAAVDQFLTESSTAATLADVISHVNRDHRASVIRAGFFSNRFSNLMRAAELEAEVCQVAISKLESTVL